MRNVWRLCLRTLFGQIRSELPAAELGQSQWREWIRVGLGVVLAFLDREPALARVCVVQSRHAAGCVVLERREEILRVHGGCRGRRAA